MRWTMMALDMPVIEAPRAWSNCRYSSEIGPVVATKYKLRYSEGCSMPVT